MAGNPAGWPSSVVDSCSTPAHWLPAHLTFALEMWPFRKSKENSETENRNVESPDSMRCATANVLAAIRWGEGGAEIKKGTKHFRGGAKVYIIDYYPGMCEGVVVVGHHRASGRYIELSMRAKHLENFRMTTVYSPKVLAVIRARHSKVGSRYDEERAQHICDAARGWAEAERNRSEQASASDGDKPSI